METIDLYGFGSYFRRSPKPSDIDILLLHRDLNEKSCRFAIGCKTKIIGRLPRVHMTILSIPEERQNKFIKRSKATYLGSVREQDFEADIDAVMIKMQEANPA